MQEIRLWGNIGRDAQAITTQSGKQFATFSLGCSEKSGKKNQDGTDEYVTTWWNIFCNVEDVKYLTKGRRVMVIGRPRISTYQGKDGQTYIDMSVVFANIYFAMSKQTNKANNNAAINTNAAPTPPQSNKEAFATNPAVQQLQAEFDAILTEDDDLPF